MFFSIHFQVLCNLFKIRLKIITGRHLNGISFKKYIFKSLFNTSIRFENKLFTNQLKLKKKE